MTGPDRRYEYVVTHDRDLIVRAGRRPVGPAPEERHQLTIDGLGTSPPPTCAADLDLVLVWVARTPPARKVTKVSITSCA